MQRHSSDQTRSFLMGLVKEHETAGEATARELGVTKESHSDSAITFTKKKNTEYEKYGS